MRHLNKPSFEGVNTPYSLHLNEQLLPEGVKTKGDKNIMDLVFSVYRMKQSTYDVYRLYMDGNGLLEHNLFYIHNKAQ